MQLEPSGLMAPATRRRRSLAVLAACLLVATMATLPVVTAASALARSAESAPAINPVLTWDQVLPDAGCPVAQSSPMVANLDGQPAVVVGDRLGQVYADHLADGSAVSGWPAVVPGANPSGGCATLSSSLCPVTTSLGSVVPVDATPSVSGAPGDETVYVGSGNAACPGVGGYQAFHANGSLAWYSAVRDPNSDTAPAQGVQASLTVAALTGGGPDVVAGSLDQEQYALDGASGAALPGWPFFTADSVFSTAAVGDLFGSGQTQIVEGGDSSDGFGRGQNYQAGGHLRILNAWGGQICRADIDQTMDSSPAIGGFLAGGATGIVVGTGNFYPGASTTNTLRAYDTGCHLQWADTLDGSTWSSPALATLTVGGPLAVVEGTDTGNGGSVWVVNADTGALRWHEPAAGRVVGSITTADFLDTGAQDLLVPTTAGLELMDGVTGAQLGLLHAIDLGNLNDTNCTAKAPTATCLDLAFQNSALVTDDPDGLLGITVAGYDQNNQGVIAHYEVPGSDGALADESGSWPMFHHDPQLTGNAGGTTAPGSVPGCQIPSAALPGYREVASDGGIFSYGSTPFCGSTGGMHLNQPVVAMTQAPSTGGYWLVASDGGIFAYGGAHFFGSMGGRHLNSPIVGMAATPDGQGYWMVAADGGIFAFGDARFYGSAGNAVLTKPVVGLAVTGDGLGYRMVTADGSVFDYGDAQSFGSMAGAHLSAPMVGMANDLSSGGYWLVASDGGIFAFNAPFLGSAGGLTLARPVVGIAATQSGQGYWLVASDGGLFAYGDARFYGSTGGKHLNAPMVGLGSL